ncbi:rhomboid family intramembrane serine protease [Neotabrizicola sp. sgz301269]|uniref:rhomboid family intramembrane serine protease n=1 Tax=Neotabrizicola sp. sgz301269 TaxID=3276282 RepID=UPI00376F69EA
MFPIRDHNPSGRRPYVTLALIAANVLIFLAYFPAAQSDYALARVYMTWGLVPARLMAGEGYETLLTHMFLHGGWMHLAGNMLFLWIFGDNLEDQMGHLGFAGFYLVSGLAAAGLQIAPDPSSPVPMVGASGAVAGVMGGYLLLFPKAKVDVLIIIVIFFRIFALPAWLILGIWFGIQLFSGLATPTAEGGVAYFAHIGGFIAGLALTLPIWLRRGAGGYWQATHGQPPHPQANYTLSRSSIPRVPRR